jgi:hypothetical protein
MPVLKKLVCQHWKNLLNIRAAAVIETKMADTKMINVRMAGSQ